MSRLLALTVQRSFPKIYLACHVDHVRTKSNRHHLSAHDSSILTHLDEETPIVAGQLARHLGVSASTLSAALKRLEALGHLVRQSAAADRRQFELRLTAMGAKAIGESSVLDTQRVLGLLAKLSPAQRGRAVAGLALLAEAAVAYQADAPRRKRW